MALQARAGVWTYLSGLLIIRVTIVVRLANAQGWLPINAAFADMMGPAAYGISSLTMSFALYQVIANQEVKHRPTQRRILYATGGQAPQYVDADEGRLQQVLENIIANVLKYAPVGEIEIKFEALEHVEKDASEAALRLQGFHHLRFSVRDEGLGIAAEHHALVFEPFSRLSTSRKKHGLGLGLAICQQILGRLNSTLHLVSRPGQGACFYFDLWLAAGEVDTTQSFPAVERQDIAIALTPPGQLFLHRASQLLELGQLVAIEKLAADHVGDHSEFDAFLRQVIACCIEVDLEGLGKLLALPDKTDSSLARQVSR
jgi:hypothetical protein